jgi:hypothetical protein
MTHLVVNVLFVLAIVGVVVVLFRRRRRKGRPFRGTYDDLTRRGTAHMTALVNEGVVSVDELLRTFDELRAEGETDSTEAEQMMRDLARGVSSEAKAKKIERHLAQLHEPPLEHEPG